MKSLSDISAEIQQMVIALVDYRIQEGETFEAGFRIYHYHFSEKWIDDALADPKLDQLILPALDDIEEAFGDPQNLLQSLRLAVCEQLAEAMKYRCDEVFEEYLAFKKLTLPPAPEHERGWTDADVYPRRRLQLLVDEEALDNQFQFGQW